MLCVTKLRADDNPEELAESLLCGVEYEMSALVTFGRGGVHAGLCLFDTRYRRLPPMKEAGSAWLISNHPMDDGRMSREDRRNLEELLCALGRENVRFFITGQDGSCREMQLSDDVIFCQKETCASMERETKTVRIPLQTARHNSPEPIGGERHGEQSERRQSDQCAAGT